MYQSNIAQLWQTVEVDSRVREYMLQQHQINRCLSSRPCKKQQ